MKSASCHRSSPDAEARLRAAVPMPTAPDPCARSEANYAWYAVHSKPREEYRARDNLARQGYQVFLPMLGHERLRAGKIIVRQEPLFARYLFVSLSEIESNWYSLRSTRGVHRIVEFGDGPVAVPADLIAALAVGERIVRPRFEAGAAVRITQGPFRNVHAIYAAPDGEQRAFLLIDILSGRRNISFPLDELV